MKKDDSFDFMAYAEKNLDSSVKFRLAEVGVFMAKDCELKDFIVAGHYVMLVEPQPACIESLDEAFYTYPDTNIEPVAVGEYPGQITLYIPASSKKNPDAGASAYIQDVHSPHAFRQTLPDECFQNTGEKGEKGIHRPLQVKNREAPVTEANGVRVECVTFDMIDPLDLDIIHMDVEGAEYYVLKHMISRPKLISLEMMGPGGYTNPYTEDIFDWMDREGYVEIARTLSDIIYERRA